MTGAKVVSIHNAQPTLERRVDEDVIKTLENVLEKARNGEVVGITGVCNYFDQCTKTIVSGAFNRATIGTLELVKADIVAQLLKDA